MPINSASDQEERARLRPAACRPAGAARKSRRSAALLPVWLVGAALIGCENGARLDRGFGPSQVNLEGRATARAIAGVTAEQVYQAALATVRAQYQVARSDPAHGIVSQPQYFEGNRGVAGGTLTFISTPAQMRRCARVQVVSEQGLVRLLVQVALQRRETQQHHAYQSMMKPGDVPHETPIDRGAGLAPERQEVWTTVRRDFAAEQELADAIAAEVAGGAQPQPPVAAAPATRTSVGADQE